MSRWDGTQNGNTDSHSQPIDLYWDLFRKVCIPDSKRRHVSNK